jgi:AbrB family looped-hinge helix DNA binding protein
LAVALHLKRCGRTKRPRPAIDRSVDEKLEATYATQDDHLETAISITGILTQPPTYGINARLTYQVSQTTILARVNERKLMTIMTVSSKGQVVLPSSTRKRLGLVAGSQLQVIDEPDGIRLTVSRPVQVTTIAACAGMAIAPSKGTARRLLEFDAASVLKRTK